MSGGGLYEGVHFDSPIINPIIPASAISPINRYERSTRVISNTGEESVKQFLEKRRRKKQQTDNWV